MREAFEAVCWKIRTSESDHWCQPNPASTYTGLRDRRKTLTVHTCYERTYTVLLSIHIIISSIHSETKNRTLCECYTCIDSTIKVIMLCTDIETRLFLKRCKTHWKIYSINLLRWTCVTSVLFWRLYWASFWRVRSTLVPFVYWFQRTIPSSVNVRHTYNNIINYYK